MLLGPINKWFDDDTDHGGANNRNSNAGISNGIDSTRSSYVPLTNGARST